MRTDPKGDTFHVRSSVQAAVTAVDGRSTRTFARHSHVEFGVGLLTDGAQRSGSGRGQVEAVRGNLITVNPGELHDGAPVGHARSWSMLYLMPQLVAGLVTDIEEGRRIRRELPAPVIDDRRMARLFVATRRAALQAQGGQAFEERVLALFGGPLEAAPPQAGTPAGSLIQVRTRIDDAPARPHSLADLAASAGLSRFQTLRGFTKLTGLTPHGYVMQRRIDRARALIRRGSALVDAAAEAGFADQSHMHRTFVSRYGFTPGTYAASVRDAAISFKIGGRISR